MASHRRTVTEPVRRRGHRLGVFVLTGLLGLALGACESDEVSIDFSPAVGDAFEFESTIRTETERIVAGERTRNVDVAVLRTTQTVIAVEDDGVMLEVAVTRDGSTPRTFTVRVERGSRLAAIDLVEGVPAAALGMAGDNPVPAAVVAPPEGELGPGSRWTIDRVVRSDDGVLVPVLGRGRLRTLGTEDGHDVAFVEVAIRLPVRSTIDGEQGRVSTQGSQTVETSTAYRLDDGAVQHDRTTIAGEAVVVVEPPGDVDAPPVEGRIRYRVETETVRLGS